MRKGVLCVVLTTAVTVLALADEPDETTMDGPTLAPSAIGFLQAEPSRRIWTWPSTGFRTHRSRTAWTEWTCRSCDSRGNHRQDSGQPSPATFLEHLGAVGGYALVGFGVLIFLSAAVPAQLGPVPVEGIEVTKPWWPFLPLFALENWLGRGGLLYAGIVIFALLALIPLLDRCPWFHPARRNGVLVLVGLLTLLLVALALYAKFAPGALHLS